MTEIRDTWISKFPRKIPSQSWKEAIESGEGRLYVIERDQKEYTEYLTKQVDVVFIVEDRYDPRPLNRYWGYFE